MKTTTGLLPRLHDPVALLVAASETARGKRRSPDVAWFLFRKEAVVRRISEDLCAGRWQPQGFDSLFIHDPKPRVISRAPFEDRVVHTTVVKLLEPVFMPSAMAADMACRRDFGTDQAILASRRFMQRHRFVVHLDIRAFFPSIDPVMVLDLVARRVRDRPFLAVVGRILRSGAGLTDREDVRAWLGLPPGWPPPGRGLPVGAHTSQFLATHVVLQELDHFIKRDLRVPGYVRFVDDMLLFGQRRADLRAWREAVGGWLDRQRSLRLKHPQARVLACAAHLDALGMRIRRDGVTPLPRAARRFRARIREAATDPDMDSAVLRGMIASSVHHLLG